MLDLSFYPEDRAVYPKCPVNLSGLYGVISQKMELFD
jgi:hypothetical protein